jgi:hypothetical protein
MTSSLVYRIKKKNHTQRIKDDTQTREKKRGITKDKVEQIKIFAPSCLFLRNSYKKIEQKKKKMKSFRIYIYIFILLIITEMDKVLLQMVETILHSLSLTCSLEFHLTLDE